MAGEKIDPRATGSADLIIGQRIRSRRLEIGMSQEYLAGLVGVTFQQIQKYEKGVNRVAAHRLMVIADCLECNIADLMPKGASARPSPADSFDETPQFIQLRNAYGKLNEEGRRAVVATARALVADLPAPKSKKKRAKP